MTVLLLDGGKNEMAVRNPNEQNWNYVNEQTGERGNVYSEDEILRRFR